MTEREHQAKLRGEAVTPAKAGAKAPPLPPVHCIYRSLVPLGKLHCTCSVSPQVFQCSRPEVVSGYCVPADPSPGQMPPDGEIILADGGKVIPDDERTRKFHVWWTRDGELVARWHVIRCDKCRFQQNPPPHILKLKQLGIQGNYVPETGHCDILNIATDAQQWVQHAVDWHATAPAGIRDCYANLKQVRDLSEFIQATGCRLIACHTTIAEPKTVESAAVAYPDVRFWVVYHGSQNTMGINANWMRSQRLFLELSARLPNVWFGTPEPTAPFGALGYQRFLIWPNTIPFEMPADPHGIHDPPVLLIAGRDDVVKANPAAVLAAALIAQQRPVKVVAAIRGNVTAYAELAAGVNLRLEQLPIRPSAQFRQFIRSSVSLVLDPSLSDAMQYVGLDALSQGRPVVGSQTIRYLPRQWQADPNDPADIARVAMQMLDDYDRYAKEALRLASEIRDTQRSTYHAAIERILAP